MPLLWDRSCTSLGGCPEGTRCAQATQSSLVCDTGLIRDMIEPSLASWTAAAIVRTCQSHSLRHNPLTPAALTRKSTLLRFEGHGRKFGAEYPLLYVILLMSGVLAIVCIEPGSVRCIETSRQLG